MILLACLLTFTAMDVRICEEVKRELMHAVDYNQMSEADAEAIYDRCIKTFGRAS